MIGALYADSVTGSRHKPNHELIGQGIATIAAGGIGGTPGGAFLVATIVNLRSGGRSRVAGLFAAGVLLLALYELGWLLEKIPYAVLAGILITNGWVIIDKRFLFNIHRIPRGYVFVMLTTALIAVIADFMSAILIGLVIAGFISARRSEKPELEGLISVPLLDREVLPTGVVDQFSARSGLVVFPERVSVASGRELVRILGPEVEGHQVAILDFSRATYIDDTAAVVIGQLIDSVSASGRKQVVISGLSGEVARTMDTLRVFGSVPKSNVASDLSEAKAITGSILNSGSPE